MTYASSTPGSTLPSTEKIQEITDALGDVFDSRPSGTWVKFREQFGSGLHFEFSLGVGSLHGRSTSVSRHSQTNIDTRPIDTNGQQPPFVNQG